MGKEAFWVTLCSIFVVVYAIAYFDYAIVAAVKLGVIIVLGILSLGGFVLGVAINWRMTHSMSALTKTFSEIKLWSVVFLLLSILLYIMTQNDVDHASNIANEKLDNGLISLNREAMLSLISGFTMFFAFANMLLNKKNKD
jgi:hypothetical protein